MTSRFRDTSRAARVALLGISSLALGATVFAVPGTVPAMADPPLTIADAKAQIAQLQVDAEALDQDWLGVKGQVDDEKASIALKQQDAKTQAAKVAQMKRQVGQAALAQFQNRNVDTAAQLFLTSDTEGFLSQISTVEKVGSNQNAMLQSYQQQQASLADLQKSSETDLAALKTKEADLEKLRTQSAAKMTEAKAVLAKLTAQEQAALAAQEALQAQQALAAAAGTGTSNTGTSTTNTGKSTTTDPGTSSAVGTGKGAVALAFARKQLGKPYVFGATGPSSYDCSGLTLAAWRAAGVSLDRTSQAQYHDGQSVSKADLQPGDLVFFYSGITHVGLYAGNGMVLHAPNSRSTVTYINMSYMPFEGARRPG